MRQVDESFMVEWESRGSLTASFSARLHSQIVFPYFRDVDAGLVSSVRVFAAGLALLMLDERLARLRAPTALFIGVG